MTRRSKKKVKARSKTHRAHVKKGRTMRKRRAARGFSPASVKRRRSAARRMAKKIKPA